MNNWLENFVESVTRIAEFLLMMAYILILVVPALMANAVRKDNPFTMRCYEELVMIVSIFQKL